MVHVVTGRDWEYIMSRLAYAKGLQARTIYWETQGIACEVPRIETRSGLETIIR